MKMEDKIVTMDVEQMRKIRAQYIAHLKTAERIGGYDLFDIYLVLHVLDQQNKGNQEVLIPFQWLNRVGGFGPVGGDQVDALSGLLVVERFAGNNGAGRIVKGLTPDGIQFLKENLKELMNDLPAFSITDRQIMNL